MKRGPASMTEVAFFEILELAFWTLYRQGKSSDISREKSINFSQISQLRRGLNSVSSKLKMGLNPNLKNSPLKSSLKIIYETANFFYFLLRYSINRNLLQVKEP